MDLCGLSYRTSLLRSGSFSRTSRVRSVFVSNFVSCRMSQVFALYHVPGSTVGEGGERRDRSSLPTSPAYVRVTEAIQHLRRVYQSTTHFLTGISEVNHPQELCICLRRWLFLFGGPRSDHFWTSLFGVIIL